MSKRLDRIHAQVQADLEALDQEERERERKVAQIWKRRPINFCKPGCGCPAGRGRA